MAHLWIYTELLKHCIAVINGDDSRTIKNKQLSLNNLPDIPTGIIDNSHIPPFPALKNNLNEFCYFDGIGLSRTVFLNLYFIITLRRSLFRHFSPNQSLP